MGRKEERKKEKEEGKDRGNVAEGLVRLGAGGRLLHGAECMKAPAPEHSSHRFVWLELPPVIVETRKMMLHGSSNFFRYDEN